LKQVRKLWKGLKRHPALASLDLGDCGLTDDSIHYVAKLLHKPKMEGGSHVSDSMASHDLDYNDLLPEGAAVLAVAISVHPEIKFVDLEGCGIGDEGASHMLAALRKPGPPKLEKLVLTNNDISVEKVKSITALLPTPS
jgi:Ran GTPase-activating protein (RanGAP) involved in mRNA processing and transport